MINLSLIVPCFNEEKTLENCIKRIREVENNDLTIEIVIVDDCSTDSSLKVAHSIIKNDPKVKLVEHKVNQGKGAALRSGFLHAKGDYVGIQDADEEYNPQQYHDLVNAMIQNNADVVFGSRYLKPETRRVLYFWHTWMNKMLTLITNMFTNLDITDMETCYKLFRREVIQEIAPKLKENRFGFEPEVTCLVSRGQYKVYECAISYNPRSYEEGKKIGWKDGVRALYCILHYGASFAPLPMQIILYFVIGAISAVVNILAFQLFSHNGFLTSLSIVISFILAALVNYFLCISILFQHRARWNTFGEVASYLITILVMGGVDYATTTILISKGLTAFVAKSVAVLLGFVGNFIFRRFFVF
ncbi:MAG: glycosyl transferase [Bdellovibrio sp. CG12_big_fil_rev_8_21_14_0_65_39_13]|nr:MAG: glycosyl transferase [Bdellovibrio sp. CG22_combo_CG10-13_8_21_14_all_39_27]PIQ62812.1 MAG: glycosyl transferase [Bdellovibrio sp. CG12_big_fil_rev_8_21_14_0_65_39_13]PIR32530.1 MAG: glycosyl transferase [Bdellovibrio sp. CG11_big_fil_rev_8_21_14_0_20_39_38]